MRFTKHVVHVFFGMAMAGMLNAQVVDACVRSPKQATYHIEAVTLLQQYLQIPSPSGNEKAAGLFFYNLCERAGLHMRLFSSDEDQFNFAASLFPLSDSLPNVILLHHLDVVDPGELEAWLFPPYSGALHNGNVYGRGAIDAKGTGIMQLVALKRFKEHYADFDFQEPHNITLLVVSGEEVGGAKGAKYVLQHHKQELNARVVYGEGGAGMDSILKGNPSAFISGVSLTEKKQLLIELLFDSDENYGHGASPSHNYANRVLLESLPRLLTLDDEIHFTASNKMMLKEFGKLETGVRSFLFPRAHWPVLRWKTKSIIRKDEMLRAFFSNSVKITQLSNFEGSGNQLPKSAKAIVDIRLLPETNVADYLARIQRLLPEVSQINILEQTPEAPPSPITPYFHKFAAALSAQYPNTYTVPILFPATSDNSHFRSEDILAYGMFPAKMDLDCLKGVHNVNERIPVSSLLEGVSVYYKLIYNILGPVQSQISAFE
ncbi:MAG: M20/M25/M40 family metallo-hydrolase [Schleiferiaceae bacterium]|nr:M20/M25/M40 family metallo-hydrolase [Schleiferiaceae bacterium]